MKINGRILKMMYWHSFIKFCSILLLMSVLGFAETAIAEEKAIFVQAAAPMDTAQQLADIEVFVREGCPHCEKAKAFLTALALERPDLRINLRDVSQDAGALQRLREISKAHGINRLSVPAFYLNGHIILGYSDEAKTGDHILQELAQRRPQSQVSSSASESCLADESLVCEAGGPVKVIEPEVFEITFLGRKMSLDQAGLPLFTLAMGLLDGFNPCSMWVLILMLSLLAPMQNRLRMFAVAGVFVAVEGMAYLIFMAAWLNLFLLIGLSRASEISIAGIAIIAGLINLKDFLAYGRGITLSIPGTAKPGIYAGIRRILQADNLWGALIGAATLAILVQIVEFLCTSGFPALYTRILTLRQLSGLSYYGYLLLYNAAYMLDDVIVLSIGIYTLSQRRLQEREGRWLKLVSGAVMTGLGLYLLFAPH
jgi:glutaredoxin